MRPILPLLLLAPLALLLSACHSNGGYMSADPALQHGPGVVEFPDPARVYLPQYRRTAVVTGHVAAVAAAPAAPVAAAAPARHAPMRAVSIVRADPSPTPVRVETPAVVTRRVVTSANVDTIRGDGVRGDALVLDRPVAPDIADVRVRGERMPGHMLSGAGTAVAAPPKGAPLPPPVADRPFRETELVVSPSGYRTR